MRSEVQHNNPDPLRVSITGIDGAGKDTVTKLALEKLANTTGGKAVKLGRPAYVVDSNGSRQIFRKTTGMLDRIHHASDSIGSTSAVMAVNALNVVVQARVLERFAAKGVASSDVIASTRDPRVDPAVYFSYYANRFLGEHVDVPQRVRTMQRLTSSERDLIVLLKVDPEVAVERIDERIRSEQQARDEEGAKQPLRAKWRHVHENVEDLTLLASQYDVALGALIDIRPATTIVEIDTTNRDRSEVVDLTHLAITSMMDHNIIAGERLIA